MRVSVNGEFLHFRCDQHEVPGHAVARNQFIYRCEVRGCERAARALWYRGEKFQELSTIVPPVICGGLLGTY